jgi:hypothetical protein
MRLASKIEIEPEVLAEKKPLTPQQERSLWEQAVLVQAKNACGNCGADTKLKVHMLVPVNAGGTFLVSNGFVLCRACEMAADSSRGATEENTRRPLNFWVSRALYNALQKSVEDGHAFGSMGALVRYLMTNYVTDEGRYDDLALYVEHGSDIKLNVWIDASVYATFKTLVNKKGMTVTDAVKGLIGVFQESVEAKEG